MAVDMKSAASVVPKLITGSLATSDTVIYTCPAGVTATIRKIRLTNVDGTARNVTLSIVNSGGSSGVTNRLMAGESVPAMPTAGYRVDLGGGDVLNEGDFISGFAPSSTSTDYIISIIEFGGASGGGLTGIQTDAIGSGGRTSGSGVATGTNAIGTGSNRYLLAALMCTMTTTGTTYTTLDSLTMSCTAGSMNLLASKDFNDGGSLGSSIHLFGIANPTSGSTQTLTTNVAKSGKSFNLTMASISLSGVASVTGAASTGPSSAAAMSLAVTSATGHRPFFAAGFDTTPMDFNQRVRAFNGNPAVAFTRPHWLILADALGAGTVTATTSSSQAYCAVGIDLVPA